MSGMPEISVITIEVSPELGAIVEAAGKILERRQKRQDDFWADLEDDLELSRLIVKELNDLYGRTLNDIQVSLGRQNSAKVRSAALINARAFLRNDTLIGMMVDLKGRFVAASQDNKLGGRRYRRIGEAVYGVHDALDVYISHLRSMQDEQPQFMKDEVRRWTLAEVKQALEGKDVGLSLDVLCEKAIRNRHKEAVYSIDGLVGEATQKIRNRKLRRG